MNASGEAVGACLRFYKLPWSQLIVVYDEVALPLGRLRVRPKGSAGGHNGLRSLIQHAGGNEHFARLRVGIGAPPPGQTLHDYVLGTFRPEEEAQQLPSVIARAADAVLAMMALGVAEAMNQFNGEAPGEKLTPQ
jgi:PTH1 family peptidyl-tRNA hydrolase